MTTKKRTGSTEKWELHCWVPQSAKATPVGLFPGAAFISKIASFPFHAHEINARPLKRYQMILPLGTLISQSSHKNNRFNVKRSGATMVSFNEYLA